MSGSDICYMSATEALWRFRNGSLSPVELMEATITRAESTEPGIGAFTQSYFDEALDGAKVAEARFVAGKRTRPLEGLPVAIKEDKGVKGKETTAGSLVFKGQIAGADALPVERIRRAGGIIHARTNVSEMGAAAITGSRAFPPTRNPWNRNYNSGGSSGGAGAALACGSTTLANGSDYCGSIRIPASSCGVVGYKPPRGRNAVSPFFNIDWYDHDGPLARSVADCALFQNVMSGPHSNDLFSLRNRLRLPDSFQPIKGWRIAVSVDLGFVEVDPEVVRNTRQTVKAFESLGAEVQEDVEIGWTEETLAAYRTHSAAVAGAWAAGYLDDYSHEMTDYAVAGAQLSTEITAKAFLHSMEVEAGMWETLRPVLQRNRILVCPTLAVPAIPLNHSPVDKNFRINGRTVAADYGWTLTYPFNMLSPLPVMSVPSGFSSDGVPTGIQIVGRPYDDLSVFACANAFEQAGSWINYANLHPPDDPTSKAGDPS